MTQSVPQLAPRVIPRDHFHGAAVDLPQTDLNFLSPHLVCALVDLGVEAFDQRLYNLAGNAAFRLLRLIAFASIV